MPIKLEKQFKDFTVDGNDLIHVPIFPQLVSIAKFDVSIALSILVFKGSVVQVSILEKIIIRCAVASVAIAHKDVAAFI